MKELTSNRYEKKNFQASHMSNIYMITVRTMQLHVCQALTLGHPTVSYVAFKLTMPLTALLRHKNGSWQSMPFTRTK